MSRPQHFSDAHLAHLEHALELTVRALTPPGTPTLTAIEAQIARDRAAYDAAIAAQKAAKLAREAYERDQSLYCEYFKARLRAEEAWRISDEEETKTEEMGRNQP